MMALDALCGVVPSEMVPTIAKKETAKEAWNTIVTMRVGDDRVKKAMTQQLHQKFDLTTFSEEVKDGKIITKMFQSLPPRFKQITIAIKTLLDVSTMFVADLTGWLKEAEEAFEEALTSL
jgi:ABC-type uncharacterized transport system permease subunit